MLNIRGCSRLDWAGAGLFHVKVAQSVVQPSLSYIVYSRMMRCEDMHMTSAEEGFLVLDRFLFVLFNSSLSECTQVRYSCL